MEGGGLRLFPRLDPATRLAGMGTKRRPRSHRLCRSPGLRARVRQLFRGCASKTWVIGEETSFSPPFPHFRGSLAGWGGMAVRRRKWLCDARVDPWQEVDPAPEPR